MNQQQQIECPLCGDSVNKLVYRYHIDNEKVVLAKIKEHYPDWTENDGICSRCIDYYHSEILMQQRILPEIGPFFRVKNVDDFVILPTPLRLDADPRYTGKGVTICFIDSGFFRHADLTAHRNRIKTIIDITKSDKTGKVNSVIEQEAAWHGTMTSVVCAGDGYSDHGLYKGIASDAELVLLKVMDEEGRITTENIIKALQWVLKNNKRYGIRIVNISLGDDNAASYKHSEIDQLAEHLIEKGIVIVAAVGNDENGMIKPPANSPNVIAVGGFDDDNSLDAELKLYHSSYGKTIDDLMKPELIANAIWIAAPVLPGTKEQKEAEVLYSLLKQDDEKLIPELSKFFSQTELDYAVSQSNNVTFIREAIVKRIQTCKYISPHYMHVDGTSFAAPIVCSLVAQMLEANPSLSPAAIREVLFSTAKRIESLPAERQGFGMIGPRRALLKILKREIIMKPKASPYFNLEKKSIEFYMQNDCASHISLSGSFNNWAQDVLLMEPGKNGIWKIEIPMLPTGRYRYKFLIDKKMWMEDVNNPNREPDGLNGFNSLLIIEN